MSNPPASRLVRAYYRSRYQRTRVLQTLSAGFDGVWLGLLSPEALGEIDDGFYRRTREPHKGELISYTDEVYTRRGLHDWEAEALERHFPSSGRIVVTGAGGGREVLALLEAGYDAIGYEPNNALVDAGNRTLVGLGHGKDRLRPMGRTTWPETGPCDAVIVGWGSLMSVPGRIVRVGFLKGAAGSMAPGGPLLVSGWHRGDDERADRVVASVGSAVRRVLGRPPVELGDRLADSFVHRFTVPEIEGELRAAGLEPVESAAEPYVWAVGRRTGPAIAR